MPADEAELAQAPDQDQLAGARLAYELGDFVMAEELICSFLEDSKLKRTTDPAISALELLASLYYRDDRGVEAGSVVDFIFANAEARLCVRSGKFILQVLCDSGRFATADPLAFKMLAELERRFGRSSTFWCDLALFVAGLLESAGYPGRSEELLEFLMSVSRDKKAQEAEVIALIGRLMRYAGKSSSSSC